MATPIVAIKSARRTLLDVTSLPVYASKSVTSIATNGTVVCTGHGYVVGNWVLLQGATHPWYNGPFQVATVVDANTFTVGLRSAPAGAAAGTLTAQQGTGLTNLWGDGTTPSGSPASVGALPSASEAELAVRFINGTTGPTAAPTALVYSSDTGTTGTWESVAGSPVGSLTALNDSSPHVDVRGYRFILAFLYGNAGSAVNAVAWGLETTYQTG